MAHPSRGGMAKSASRSAQLKQSASAVGLFLRRTIFKDPFSLVLLGLATTLLITFFLLLGTTRPDSPGQEVALTTANRLADDGRVTDATLLDADARISFTTESGEQLWAAYLDSDAATGQLVARLQRAGTRVSVDQQSYKPIRRIIIQFLLPILILVCLFSFFMRLMADDGSGGIASFSDSKAAGKKRKKGQKAPVTFDDVAGAPEALTELREIRDYLHDPQKYARLGAGAPKGVLLVGPPGTGKTLLARATAGEAEATFFSISGSDFVESLVGVGAARVRDLFRKARKAAPAIIFIDELDAAGRKRGAGVGQGNDEREQTLNQLLVEMDGFGGDAGLVVMGATNRPDILDDALLRPGRFDRQITVDNPDVHGRLEILQLHAKGRPLGADSDLTEIARLTPGFSGAELANVINEGALLTVREGRSTIDQATLEEAIDRVVAGPAKKSHILSESERRVIAVHEAAHAVVTKSIGQAVSAQKLSIVARGRTLGTAAHMLTDRDQVIQQETDLRRQLISVLSGAAGEKLAFGTTSTTVHDDLHAATAIARSMITAYGMSEAIGPMTVGEKQGEVFLGASLQELGSIGPATLDKIDHEVARIITESMERAKEVLRANWPAVDETARVLLEQETLSGMALEAVLSTVVEVPVANGNGDNGERLEGNGRTAIDADGRTDDA